jgi:hypothetical protein
VVAPAAYSLLDTTVTLLSSTSLEDFAIPLTATYSMLWLDASAQTAFFTTLSLAMNETPSTRSEVELQLALSSKPTNESSVESAATPTDEIASAQAATTWRKAPRAEVLSNICNPP